MLERTILSFCSRPAPRLLNLICCSAEAARNSCPSSISTSDRNWMSGVISGRFWSSAFHLRTRAVSCFLSLTKSRGFLAWASRNFLIAALISLLGESAS